MAAPTSWRLDWRDYRDHHTGSKRPQTFRKRFRTEAAARLALARLGADPDAVIVGFVTACPDKPLPTEQIDFGFPMGEARRLTD